MKNNFVDKDKNVSDDELVLLINSGNFEYLQILINRYMPLILKISLKYKDLGFDMDDLIQEGTVAVFSAVKSFDENKASFSTFAELCVSRAIASVAKRGSAAKRIPDKLISPLDDFELQSDSTPEDIIINKESYKSFTDNIKLNLSDMEYKVLCAFVEGKTYSEISKLLGVEIKSVDNALKRIRQKLKSI